MASIVRLAAGILVVCSSRAALADEAAELVGRQVMVRQAEARLRHGPRVVGKATGGAVLRVTRAEHGWLWVGEGWIHHADVVAYDQALEFFTEEIARRPSVYAYSHRSRLWFDRGDYEKGIADCTAALALDAEYAPALGNRGWARSRLEDYHGAIADLSAAIRLDPGHAGNRVSRGMAYLRRGDHDRAIADFDAALRLAPATAAVVCYRGQAWFEKGEYHRAIADHDAALRLDPRHAAAWFHRAQARMLIGQYEQAAADYERAARLDPGCALPAA